MHTDDQIVILLAEKFPGIEFRIGHRKNTTSIVWADGPTVDMVMDFMTAINYPGYMHPYRIVTDSDLAALGLIRY